ncbi:hypothetical protein SXCC_03358 [Gluconacetobacter sp. SXCC-1]|nr:hypothetical protein SXCC_03358 [Gluconacetobacter sp. SXCC-1]
MMKPKPLVALNHFTFPVAIASLFSSAILAGPNTGNPGACLYGHEKNGASGKHPAAFTSFVHHRGSMKRAALSNDDARWPRRSGHNQSKNSDCPPMGPTVRPPPRPHGMPYRRPGNAIHFKP